MDQTAIAAEASVEVPLPPQAAFELYTRGIDRWWRPGTMYWNDGKRAKGLRFEPFVGGRFIEVYDQATGEGFEIGQVLAWEPGRRLSYTWREAGWGDGESTTVEVTFEPTTSGTHVSLRQTGWENVTDGLAMSRGYSQGAVELLGWFGEVAAGI
jgi:uncharacterized protein YndB with AHSA1/START domain